MIKKGDKVVIKPEWRDPGDGDFHWIALEDEDGGRVRIGPIDTGMAIRPSYVIETRMLENE